jgi:hypothetical protein
MGSTARPERQAAYGLPFGAVVWAEATSSSGREAGTSRHPGTEPITRLVHADDPLGRGSGGKLDLAQPARSAARRAMCESRAGYGW